MPIFRSRQWFEVHPSNETLRLRKLISRILDNSNGHFFKSVLGDVAGYGTWLRHYCHDLSSFKFLIDVSLKIYVQLFYIMTNSNITNYSWLRPQTHLWWPWWVNIDKEKRLYCSRLSFKWQKKTFLKLFKEFELAILNKCCCISCTHILFLIFNQQCMYML